LSACPLNAVGCAFLIVSDPLTCLLLGFEFSRSLWFVFVDSPHTGIPTVGTGRGTGSRSLFWATVLHPNDVHEADVPPASTPSVDSCKLEEPLSGGSAARVLHCLPAADTHVPRAGGPVPASQQWLPSLPSAPHAPGAGHHQGRDGLLRLQPSLTSDSQRPVFVEGKESPSRRYMLTPPTARPTELLLSTNDHARRASGAATGSTEATVPMHRGATPSVDSDVPPRTPTVGAPPRGTAQRGTASPCGTCTPSAATVSDNAQSSVGDDAGSGGRSGGAARYPCRDCGQLFRQPRDVKVRRASSYCCVSLGVGMLLHISVPVIVTTSRH